MGSTVVCKPYAPINYKYLNPPLKFNIRRTGVRQKVAGSHLHGSEDKRCKYL